MDAEAAHGNGIESGNGQMWRVNVELAATATAGLGCPGFLAAGVAVVEYPRVVVARAALERRNEDTIRKTRPRELAALPAGWLADPTGGGRGGGGGGA